jgi:predicted kinase
MTSSDDLVTPKPLLLVVTGSPASGKTTVAELLAEAMHLPLMSKDVIKEEIYDSLDDADPSDSHRLGYVAIRLMHSWARQLLEKGVPVILESNFKRSLSVPGLQELFSLSRPVLVQCSVPAEDALRRYVERSEKGERHPVHDDANHVDELKADLEKGEYDLTGIGAPTLRVDTSDSDCTGIVQDLIIRIRSILSDEPVPLEADSR